MRSAVKTCPGCGFPLAFSSQCKWTEHGTIVQADNPRNRLLFLEVPSLRKVFDDLQDLLGIPIDRIIAEGKRKTTLEYLRGLFQPWKLAMARAFARKAAYRKIAETGALMGYGHYELVEVRRRQKIQVFGENVYLEPFFTGDLAAVFNFIEGLPAEVQVEKQENGLLITVVPGRENHLLETRLAISHRPVKEGDFKHARCSCGLPERVAAGHIDLEKGIIEDGATGRRAAVVGLEGLESVFRELENELGEEIRRQATLSYRDYLLEGGTFQAEDGPYGLRGWLATTGMGNLVAVERDEGKAVFRVENPGVPPLLVGAVLAFFQATEGSQGKESVSEKGGGLVVAVHAGDREDVAQG